MNEQRLKAYRQLIQQLLECPAGQELEDILQNHQHLIDAGLIAVMQQYAQYMTEAGSENNARWLLNIAKQLTQRLNQWPNPVSKESYITLLKQLLRAELEFYTCEANENIVYKILDNNQQIIDENLSHILPQYASDLINNYPYPEDIDTIVALIENLGTNSKQPSCCLQ